MIESPNIKVTNERTNERNEWMKSSKLTKLQEIVFIKSNNKQSIPLVTQKTKLRNLRNHVISIIYSCISIAETVRWTTSSQSQKAINHRQKQQIEIKKICILIIILILHIIILFLSTIIITDINLSLGNRFFS